MAVFFGLVYSTESKPDRVTTFPERYRIGQHRRRLLWPE